MVVRIVRPCVVPRTRPEKGGQVAPCSTRPRGDLAVLGKKEAGFGPAPVVLGWMGAPHRFLGQFPVRGNGSGRRGRTGQRWPAPGRGLSVVCSTTASSVVLPRISSRVKVASPSVERITLHAVGRVLIGFGARRGERRGYQRGKFPARLPSHQGHPSSGKSRDLATVRASTALSRPKPAPERLASLRRDDLELGLISR
jgi:hypothetical protein